MQCNIGVFKQNKFQDLHKWILLHLLLKSHSEVQKQKITWIAISIQATAVKNIFTASKYNEPSAGLAALRNTGL